MPAAPAGWLAGSRVVKLLIYFVCLNFDLLNACFKLCISLVVYSGLGISSSRVDPQDGCLKG